MVRTLLDAPLRYRLVALLVVATHSGCASQAPPDPFAAARFGPAIPFDLSQAHPDEITRKEIVSRGQNVVTAFALIRRLRPSWLRARGQTSFTSGAASYPIVYIDEVWHGGLPTLHRIPTSEIQRLEFYNTADATTRWGTGHPSGVINVVTGRF
ncbi:MAG: hypothetical protein HKN72_12500 [Gemmatimonadetes bacterium]|nr:hypothetical protein [Gemmatimonadota bacterium]